MTKPNFRNTGKISSKIEILTFAGTDAENANNFVKKWENARQRKKKIRDFET